MQLAAVSDEQSEKVVKGCVGWLKARCSAKHTGFVHVVFEIDRAGWFSNDVGVGYAVLFTEPCVP
jgi:hypothetical protein